jgi:ketosteroid isomerase-like protein
MTNLSGNVTPETAPVSAVRRYYALVDAGDVPGLTSLFAPDTCYHRPGYQPLTGRDELQRFYREDRVIVKGAHTLTAIVADGRDVAVQGEFSGQLRDGRETSLRFADFFSFAADGLIARRDTFFFSPMV